MEEDQALNGEDLGIPQRIGPNLLRIVNHLLDELDAGLESQAV